MSVSRSVSWVHVSDLHADTGSTYHSSGIINALIEDLRSFPQTIDLIPDFLFFTGDIARGHSDADAFSRQYDLARGIVERIASALHRPIDIRNIYFVPGNHDVFRTAVLGSITDFIDRLDVERANNLIASASSSRPSEFVEIAKRFDPYRNFLKKLKVDHLIQDELRLAFCDIREVNGVKVGIAGLNTSWSCCRDSLKENGRLIMGANYQLGAANEIMAKAECDFRLALMHHPPAWFIESDRADLVRRLRSDFDLSLHGHEHDRDFFSDHGVHRLSAGVLSDHKTRVASYSLGKFVAIDARKMAVWFRKFDPASRKFGPDAFIPYTNDRGMLERSCSSNDRNLFKGKDAMTGEGVMIRDLTGKWKTEYQRAKKKRTPLEGWLRKGVVSIVPKVQDGIVLDQEFSGTCDETDPPGHKFKIRGTVRNTNWFVGTWQSIAKGSSYHGAFVLYIDNDGRTMNGKWLGIDAKGVDHGNWKWERSVEV